MQKKKKIVENLPILSPRENVRLIGHEPIIDIFLKAFDAKKIPNGWLLSGPKGIGKATIAYKIARMLLSGVRDDVSETHPVFRKVAANNHSDLLVIEKEEDASEIKVDNIRKINDFLHMTSSETGYRVVIIDSADDMNNNAANSLLKLLEEPPTKAFFILISHSPGALLTTIKSRCRKINVFPLDKNDAISVVNSSLPEASPIEIAKLVELADFSPGVAIDFYENDGLKIYNELIKIFSSPKGFDFELVHKLGESISQKINVNKWNTFKYLLNLLMVRIARDYAASGTIGNVESNNIEPIVEKQLEEFFKIWEKVNSLLGDVERINLDKKSVVINIFEELGLLDKEGTSFWKGISEEFSHGSSN